MSYYERSADRADYFNFTLTDHLKCVAHFHNAIEIVFVEKGETTACVNGESRVLKSGDVCFVNPFDIHFLR